MVDWKMRDSSLHASSVKSLITTQKLLLILVIGTFKLLYFLADMRAENRKQPGDVSVS